MKTKIGLSQFVAHNTPLLAQKIGDLSLLCATLAIMIWGIPAMMVEAGFTGFILPVFLVKIAKVCAAIGIFGKFFTKLLGKTTNDGTPITTVEQIERKAEAAK